MSQNKKARAANRIAFGNTSEEVTPAKAYAHYNKQLPKKKTDIGKISAHLCSEYTKPGDPTSVSPIHLNVFRKIYEIGIRENVDELPEVKCSECGETHPIICTECGKEHVLNVLDPSKEKNTIACLKLMADKWFPNKAAVANDFNEEQFLEKITEYVSRLISILPVEQQQTYTEMWVTLVGSLENEA
jgi:hypothetical protein